jgi:hypothetical protein
MTLDISANVVSVFIGTTNTLQCFGPAARTLTISGNAGNDFTQWSETSIFKPCNGLKIVMSASTGTPGISSTGFSMDNVDLGPLHTISSLTVSRKPGACVSGDRWSIFSADTVSGVAVGDLLQLMSGAQRGRMYEIVGLSGAHVTICPSFPDASSLGAHLTPHLTRLAPDQPGAVPNPIPAAGDQFLAWKPWGITGTSLPFLWGDLGTGKSHIIGAQVSNISDANGHGLSIGCAETRPPVIISHNNFFNLRDGVDWGFADEGTSGCNKPLGSWNVIHDSDIPEGRFSLGFLRNTYSDTSPTVGGALVFNTFYRLSHNTIQVNHAGSPYPIVGTEVGYNIAFETDILDQGEAEFLEIDSCDHCTIQSNIGWKLGTRGAGIVAKPSAETLWTNNLVRWNYIHGTDRGIQLGSENNTYGPGNIALGNYTDTTVRFGIQAFVALYNIVHGYNVGNDVDGPYLGLHAMRAIQAEGNVVDGAGSARAEFGLYFPTEFIDTTTKRLARGNICRNLTLIGSGVSVACIRVDDAGTANMDIMHNVAECADEADCHGLVHCNWSPSSATILNVKDNIVTGTNASAVAAWVGYGANVTSNLVNLTRFGGISAAEGSWSTSTGEVDRNPLFVDAANNDYNLMASSQELGAGSAPVGSSIGVRAMRFPIEMFPAYVRAVMSVPTTVITEPVSDSDMDVFPSFMISSTDQVDACPFVTDSRNGYDNSSVCKNTNAGAGKPVNKGPTQAPVRPRTW